VCGSLRAPGKLDGGWLPDGDWRGLRRLFEERREVLGGFIGDLMARGSVLKWV
jgi:hypothetical protein